ncbi:exocyst complex component Sec10-domain-containing protein [Myxozyma melibiosi]|uniref:Exocyst complex component Sec10-domain-containing protein n=1 Tax=Myxozyma melibiosi TaxID=54550 RepID=A0ABR1EY52_9ASCO
MAEYQPASAAPQRTSTGGTASYPGSMDATEADAVPSLDDARLFVGWLSESVARAAQLSSKIEIPQYAKDLLLVLIESLGSLYIEVALDHTTDRLAQEKISDTLSDTIDRLLPACTDILQLISNTANKLLMELAADSSATRKEMSQVLMDYVAAVERKIKTLETAKAAQQAALASASLHAGGGSKRRWKNLRGGN